MKMKKRIFLSNTLMVWLSLMTLFATGCMGMAFLRSRMMDVFIQNRLGQLGQEAHALVEQVFLSFVVLGLVAIGVILLISQLFTRSLVRRIMKPIDLLTQSAARIEAGDFQTPIEYTGDREFMAVCTAFNEMQRHLREEQEKNAAYERMRTDMISGISHDLRTPLTSVKGYIKGIQDGVASTPEKQADYLAIAYRRADDMERLLQRLFFFSKLETGNLPFFPVEADLGEFAAHYAESMTGELAEQGVIIRWEATPGPHPVSIDPEQMDRVLQNLTENALKYAGVPQLEVYLAVSHQDGRELLTFSDNGQGVAPEKLPHIFGQFYRGDESRSSRGAEGSGLGLYIVSHIVQSHGGRVWAQPGRSGGLQITLSLPSRTPSQRRTEPC